MSKAAQRLIWRDMKASTLNPRRLLAHAVLAMLLLLGQHTATRHWLSHAIEATQAKVSGIPAQTHCDDCDGLVAFGAALPTLALALPLVTDLDNVERVAASPSAPDIARPTGYLLRAPPMVG